MRDPDKYLRIAETIAQLESGTEISSERQNEIDEWLAESEENRQFFDRVVRRESLEGYESVVAQIDFVKMSGEVGHKVRQRCRRRQALRAVAASVAVVLVAAGVFTLHESTVERGNGAVDVIAPGTTQALMILPDGHRMELGAQQPDEALRNYMQFNSSETAEQNEVSDMPQKIRIEIPRGGEYRFTLSDGTAVWLNSETVIEYPGLFNDGDRAVYLEGEAFFDVARDVNRPFEIDTPDGLAITVLGTRFNVSNYADSGDARVTLCDGAVALSMGDERFTLSPDQQAVLDRGSRSITVRDVPDAGVFSAWTDGKFVFEFAAIEDVMNQLARWYNVEIEYEHRPTQRFGGSISRNVDLAQALELLKITEAVDFEITDNKVIVKNI
jgi:ferric-dicitrate binding protein FerR (iron transport regulator)